MKKIISLLLLVTIVFTGCSQVNVGNVEEEEFLITEITGENNLDKKELETFLEDLFEGMDFIPIKTYDDDPFSINFNYFYNVDKTQEEVDKIVLETAFMMFEITKLVAVNYEEDCRIKVEFKINDGEINYYASTKDVDYLEGDNNYDLLNSYMKNINVSVYGDNTGIRNSILKSFIKYFNIEPNYV